mgnify:CR=1 FL=1
MICPFCEHPEHRVVESRVADTKDAIRRRRECQSCGRRFTTCERCEEMPLVVVKTSGERQSFDRGKLLKGLEKACEKRPVSLRQLEEIVDAAEGLLTDQEDRELSTSEIGAFAMERLRELDQVAYVRFASVYRRFEDVGEFMEELKTLLKKRGTA